MRLLPAFLLIAFVIPDFSCFQLSAQKQGSSKNVAEKQIRFQDVLYDIRAFSKRIKKADSDEQRIDAIVDLCTLYLRVVSDSRFGRSEVLQGYRGRIAYRLRQEQKPIQRKLKSKSKNVSTGDSKPDSPKDESADQRMISSVSDWNWRLLSHASGGTGPTLYNSSGMFGTPGYFWRGRGGGMIGDNGQELVELIETVLHPDFWSTNGGAGTVYYYQPQRILVVRATTTVHEDLTKFLEMLR